MTVDFRIQSQRKSWANIQIQYLQIPQIIDKSYKNGQKNLWSDGRLFSFADDLIKFSNFNCTLICEECTASDKSESPLQVKNFSAASAGVSNDWKELRIL